MHYKFFKNHSVRYLDCLIILIVLLTVCVLQTGCSTGHEDISYSPSSPAASDLEVLPQSADNNSYAPAPGDSLPDMLSTDSSQPDAEPVPSDSASTDLADYYLTGTDLVTPEVSPTPIIVKDSTDMNDIADFSISEITDDIFSRIYGKSYPKDCTLDIEELRYLTVLHMGFDGQTHVGELIVNKKIASATLEIFEELYAIDYPIEKIRLIDEYNADDEASMEDNNSSAFNYRYIAETTVLSNHALGFAIDINTLYNPYVYTRKDGSLFLQPVNAGAYVDRSDDCPYYIRKDDACYEIFTAHGFSWGGDWNTKKDYQHFEYSNP